MLETHFTDNKFSELLVTVDDFAASMSKVGPSIQRGYETVVEKKGWDDIGGLEDVKKVRSHYHVYYILYYSRKATLTIDGRLRNLSKQPSGRSCTKIRSKD